MRAFKLDYTTVVLGDRYANVPGVEYYEVVVDGVTLRFAQHNNTVLPAMLEEMVSQLNRSHSTSVSVSVVEACSSSLACRRSAMCDCNVVRSA